MGNIRKAFTSEAGERLSRARAEAVGGRIENPVDRLERYTPLVLKVPLATLKAVYDRWLYGYSFNTDETLRREIMTAYNAGKYEQAADMALKDIEKQTGRAKPCTQDLIDIARWTNGVLRRG